MHETDPIDVALDINGDILIDENGLHLIYGIEGVAQAIRTRIRLFKGEWFMNLDLGIPYHQEILGEKFNEPLLRQRLSEAIKGTPGVVEILSLVITFSASRRVSVTWSVRCEFGDIPADTMELS